MKRLTLPSATTEALRASALLVLAACIGQVSTGADDPRGEVAADDARDRASSPSAPTGSPDPAAPAASRDLPPATLRRLTPLQYANSVRDLLGVAPDTSKLTAIPPVHGLRALGAASITLPSRDVEELEASTARLTQQLFADAAQRQKVVGCDAAQPACAREFVENFGRRVLRRPLLAEEQTRHLALYTEAAQKLGDPSQALGVVASAWFQSASFLYRVELGTPDAAEPRRRKLSDYELASRLSYFLWNSTPDPELLDAAAAGELAREEGLLRHAKRLLASPRAVAASEELFTDYLALDALDSLAKLPEVYPAASSTLAAAMKEETLRSLKTFLFERALDFRAVFSHPRTFVNAELAKLYGVRPPSGTSFVEVELPADGPRAGLLMQASFLALHAHPGRSSPTLRGKFIRENLLCQGISPPPNNVDTSLPSMTGATTARQRLEKHALNPGCAACHDRMDPLGLALETFDGIGAHRTHENGIAIDASGELDDVKFRDARGLANALADNPELVSCFVRTLLRYARGALELDGESALVEAVTREFRSASHRLPDLMLAIVRQPVFRYAGAMP